MITDLIKSNRSYRRFDFSHKITEDELRRMIDSARLSSSGGNMQVLRFAMISGEKGEKLFPHLKFAAYLKEWEGPSPEERPSAYIAVMLDKELTGVMGINIGIAAEAILLTASEMGYGGCMFRSFDKEEVDSLLGKAPYRAELIIALGKPCEQVKIVDCTGDIKYYRDENDVHCVPKLSLDQLII